MQDVTPSPKAPLWARLGLVALVLSVLGGAYAAGLFAYVSAPSELARAMVELGPWGYLLFVCAYAALQPFGVPGTVFIVAAPLIWAWPVAFALSMVGTMAASVVGFSFARFIARDWLAPRVPARLRKYDAALERSAFLTVFALRLIFWMPQVLHTFFGVSKVKFTTHFWGSLLGYVPPLLVVSYMGGELFDGAGNLGPRAWTSLAGLLAFSLGLVAALRWLDRRADSKLSAG